MIDPSVVTACLASTGFAGLSTALKHRVASRMPARDGSRTRYLLQAATHPLWIAGLLSDATAVSLQVYALHIGDLTVVQPLLITALPTSIVIHHALEGTRPSRRELLLATELILALVGFLSVSGATSGQLNAGAQAADRTVAVLAASVAVAITLICLIAAKVQTQGRNRAALIGVAVAFIYASTAALIKACTNIFARSPWALLTSWQLYLLVVAGLLGLLLTQVAFHAGPLTASLPAIAALDPVLSVALGVLVYDEALRRGETATTLELLLLGALATGAFLLSRQSTAQSSPAPGAVPTESVTSA